MSLHPSTWVEIDLSAIRHNVRVLRTQLAASTHVMAVVKADAYGHGAIEVARAAIDSGATYLAVARIQEALHLRLAGITDPILMLEPITAHTLAAHIDHNLTATISDPIGARVLLDAFSPIRAHIKIDTGMGRLGLPANAPETVSIIHQLHAAAHIHLEGIYSHFARADESDLTFSHQQLNRFLTLLETLQENKITFPLRHIANSAGTLQLPESHLDMVRIGISLYGYAPSDAVRIDHLPLKPAMSVKSRISHVKKVPVGFPVSYNSIFETHHPTTLITIPIGYADGFRRSLSNRGHILYKGNQYPIVGRVCMDQIVVDIGNTPADIGDEITVMGQDGQTIISAQDIARQIDTISYEVLCNFVARAPRIYTS